MNGPLWIIGCPSHLGGADTELWDTMQLWRSYNVPLRLTPTWTIPDEWRRKCQDIGVEIVSVPNPQELAKREDLEGATVISYCNGEFLKIAPMFAEKHCRVIWVNCMCWVFDAEREYYKTHGPFDTYIFQSNYQKSLMLPDLAQYGVKEEQTNVIHSPFELNSFPFGPRPHVAGTEFYVGRLSRPDPGKFSSNLWPIYTRVPYAQLHARVMGWDAEVEKKLGPPPPWAEVLPACAQSSQAFLSSLHAMVPINGGCKENWPRTGLEAMAAGVPIVTQNEWGWREMVQHGKTGFLCDNDADLAYYTALLAHDEALRLEMAQTAHDVLVTDLANRNVIGQKWCTVLGHESDIGA